MPSPRRMSDWTDLLLLGRPVIRLTHVKCLNQSANCGNSLIVWKTGGTATKTARTCRTGVNHDGDRTKVNCTHLAVGQRKLLIAIRNPTPNFNDWYPIRCRYHNDGHEMYEGIVSPNSHPTRYISGGCEYAVDKTLPNAANLWRPSLPFRPNSLSLQHDRDDPRYSCDGNDTEDS